MSGKYEPEKYELELGGDLFRVPVHELITPLTRCRDVTLDIMRLDQIHPLVSGNKWFKLKPAIESARKTGMPVLSFGGAWSNHIHALAYAGAHFSVPTLGIIRGEPEYASNAMLTDARHWGMKLHFVTRAEYRQRTHPDYLQSLLERFGPGHLVPEGGSQAAALPAVATIWQHPVFSEREYDAVFLPVGTGGTLAGVLFGAPSDVEVIGVPVLRYGEWLERDISALLQQAGGAVRCKWSLDPVSQGAGYARLNAEEAALLRQMQGGYGLDLDPVYTVKVLRALQRRIVQCRIKPHSRILMLHTGGLQGNRGFADRLSALAPEFVGPLPL